MAWSAFFREKVGRAPLKNMALTRGGGHGRARRDFAHRLRRGGHARVRPHAAGCGPRWRRAALPPSCT
ncbi:MAG: hypothetical protein WKG07_41200 [Hymenobacter sp.]